MTFVIKYLRVSVPPCFAFIMICVSCGLEFMDIKFMLGFLSYECMFNCSKWYYPYYITSIYPFNSLRICLASEAIGKLPSISRALLNSIMALSFKPFL